MHTTKPEVIFDYEKAKEALKNDSHFAGLEFAELEKEDQVYYLSDYDTIYVRPVKEKYYIGYSSDLDSIKKEFQSKKYFDGSSNKVNV